VKEPDSRMLKLNHLELVEAFRGLSLKKQCAVMEELQEGLFGETPDGLKVSARNRKELRRFICEQDAHVLEWMRTFDTGEVFYDIGANVGGLTLAAAAMHPGRLRIVAIEPSFSNFESLVRNLSRNALLDRTIPLQVALLDRTGLEPMNYRSTAAGTALHGVGAARDSSGESFVPVSVQPMPTYTLDDLIGILKLPAPTRLKIDVDGYEESVLRGALGTLGAGTVRDLVIEVVNHDGLGTRLKAVASLLGGQGYDLVDTFEHEATHGRDKSMVADYRFRANHRESRGQDPPDEVGGQDGSASEAAKAAKEARAARKAERNLEKQARAARKAAASKQGAKEARVALKAEEAARRIATNLASAYGDAETGPAREAAQAAGRAARAARKAEEVLDRLTAKELQEESGTPQGLAAKEAFDRLSRELANLRGSYYLSGAEKKIDIRDIDGFSDLGRLVIAEGRSYLDYDRLFTLWQAVMGAPRDGPVAEIGTYRGGSAKMIAETLRRLGRSPHFYVCDTFAGSEGVSPDVSSMEAVAAYLKDYANVEIVPGNILETTALLPQDAAFSFVHVDVDWFAATDACLRFFGPRLAPGAVIVVDDYGFVTCPGAKRAVDEFVALNPAFRLIHLLTGQGVLFRGV
jgi:O-methyltransferase